MKGDYLEPDPGGAERDRQECLALLRQVLDRIYDRGMALQDEPWWSEYCALRREFEKVYTL